MSGSQSIEVSAPQGVFLSGLDTKFRAYVGGFGSGKTFIGCYDLLLFAGKHPGLTQGYFAPTYRDIRDTFWPTLDEAAELLGFTITIKRADKEVDVFRGNVFYGTIICRSMEDPGAIVGFKIARALVDEIDILPTEKAKQAWRKIIARLRQVVPGVVNGVGVTTTPEGFRFVYETFKSPPGESAASRSNYSMVQASTYENERFLPPDYIQSLRDDYPSELIDAYLMGEFVNLTSGTVYRAFDRAKHDSTETIQQPRGDRPGETLFVGMDFNVGQMSAKVYVARDGAFHMVEEIDNGRDTPWMIDTINSRYSGHKVIVFPDASGKNTTSKSASTSDLDLLRQGGFLVRAKSRNPRVRERVLAVNKAFEDGRLFVNTKACPVATRCLEQQAYDKNGEPDKSSGFDHSNDAAGYFVAYEMPVIKPVARKMRLGY